LFENQPEEFQKTIIGDTKRVVVAEAGTRMGWEGFVSNKKDLFCLDRFGESGPAAKVAEDMHFTAKDFAELLSK